MKLIIISTLKSMNVKFWAAFSGIEQIQLNLEPKPESTHLQKLLPPTPSSSPQSPQHPPLLSSISMDRKSRHAIGKETLSHPRNQKPSPEAKRNNNLAFIPSTLHTGKEERRRTEDKKGEGRDRMDERRVTRREGREREKSKEWKIVFRPSHTQASATLACLPQPSEGTRAVHLKFGG